MSCCHRNFERGFDGFRDGFRDGVRFHDDRKFRRCKPIVKRVTCIRPSCECDEPTVIEVTGLFNELATNNCFDLVFCHDTLQNNSCSPVCLTDGEQSYLLIEGFTGNTVKYDQLVQLVDFHKNGHRHNPCKPRRCETVLRCFFGNDGPPGMRLHIMCDSPLPASTHVPNRRGGVDPEVEEVI